MHYSLVNLLSTLKPLPKRATTMTATVLNPTQTVPPVAPLSNETKNILEFAFYLQQQKQTLSRKDFKKLVQSYGWTGEEKIYLKMASVFQVFSPSDLAAIEPNTLFVLAKNHKKYAAVIQQMASLEEITQDAVKNLMKLARKKKVQKKDEASIWRYSADGGRHVQFPPSYDEHMGVMAQSMMDEEGLTIQRIIKEGLCLRKGLQMGLLGWVDGISQLDALMTGDSDLEAFTASLQPLEEFVVGDTSDTPAPKLEAATLSPTDNTSVAEPHELLTNTVVTAVTNLENIESIQSNNKSSQLPVEQAFDILSSLKNQLSYVVENITSFTLKEVKEAEKLVRQIINFCNSQPEEQQWLTLAEITKRNSNALVIFMDFIDKDTKEWFFNLPVLLAGCAVDHPEELLWVDNVLREEAESMLNISTV